MEGPALGAMLAGRGGTVQHLAFAAVEAAEVAARERDPEDAVGVDVAAARAVARERDFVVFGERGEGRVRAGRDADDAARIAHHRAPYRAVERADRDREHVDRDALVLLRLCRLVGLHIGAALAVAARIEHERGPALRLRLVAGTLIDLTVHPAEHAGAAGAGAVHSVWSSSKPKARWSAGKQVPISFHWPFFGSYTERWRRASPSSGTAFAEG